MSLMKWLPFTILAIITILLQTTIVPAMAVKSVWPDWMFVLAVHYALWAPWPEAAVAAWLLGLTLDVYTGGPIGLHAFCYGLAACLILRIRQAVFRQHYLTQIVITGTCTLAIQVAIGLYYYWRGQTEASQRIGPMLTMALFTALYTAVWAPYLHWPLNRLQRWTGLATRGHYSAA